MEQGPIHNNPEKSPLDTNAVNRGAMNRGTTRNREAQKLLDDLHEQRQDSAEVKLDESKMPTSLHSHRNAEKHAPEGTKAPWSTTQKIGLASLAVLAPAAAIGAADLATTANQQQPTTPTSTAGRVTSFAQQAWQPIDRALRQGTDLSTIENIENRWHDIEAILHVSDQMGLQQAQQMRATLVREGASNPDIPAMIVHSALYTTSVYVEHLNDQRESKQNRVDQLNQLVGRIDGFLEQGSEINTEVLRSLRTERERVQNDIDGLADEIAEINEQRSDISRDISLYLDRVILDTESRGGVRQRQLVLQDEAESLAENYPIADIYDRDQFGDLAEYIIGKVADEETLTQVAEQLLHAEAGSARQRSLHNIILHTQPGTALPSDLINQIREWVFGTEGSSGPGHSSIVEPASWQILRRINTSTVAHRLPDHTEKSTRDQEFIASNILLLARNNDPRAVAATSQWFANKSLAQQNQRPSRADYMVLEALGIVAQRDRTGFEVLKRVTASYPDMVITRSLIVGSAGRQDTADARAAKAIRSAFRSNDEASHELFRNLVDRDAEALWPRPTKSSDLQLFNAQREEARSSALSWMVLSESRSEYIETFRDILDNRFATQREVLAAIQGAALCKDEQSLRSLIDRGMDPTASRRVRQAALNAALSIDMPEVMPQSIRDRVLNETPFSTTAVGQFITTHDARTGRALDAEVLRARVLELRDADLIQARVNTRLQAWQSRQNATRALHTAVGEAPQQVSSAERLRMTQALLQREYGGSRGLFKTLAQDPEVQEQLQEMVEYLESTSDPDQPLDLSVATPMIHTLSKSEYEPARRVLLDIAVNPEQYASDPHDDSFWALQDNGRNTYWARLEALESLGGVMNLTDPDDPAAAALLRVTHRDSSRTMRATAFKSFARLAERYNDRLENQELADQHAGLREARLRYARSLTEHMQHWRQGHDDATQRRLAQMWDEFTQAKVIDQLGGTEHLLQLANRELRRDPDDLRTNNADTERNERSSLPRSVVHAMLANGRSVQDIQNLNLPTATKRQLVEIFNFVANERFWVGNGDSQTTQGAAGEFALIDVGYALENPVVRSLGERIIYPENLIDWSEVRYSSDYHPTAVSTTFHERNPDWNIRTYTATGRVPVEEFRPSHTNDPMLRALEDLAELQITGEADVDVINYSLGFNNIVLHDAEYREQLLDLIRAHMQVLSSMGIQHSIAAGNSYGENPATSRYGVLGEVNSLGIAVTQRGDIRSQDGVFVAAAQDAYTGSRLAEFTSVGDALRADRALDLIAFDGVHVLLPWVENGSWVLIPLNGTSFASPNQSAMLAWGRRLTAEAGVELSHREWQELFQRSKIDIRERAGFEGGAFFHTPTFLSELSEVIRSRTNSSQ